MDRRDFIKSAALAAVPLLPAVAAKPKESTPYNPHEPFVPVEKPYIFITTPSCWVNDTKIFDKTWILEVDEYKIEEKYNCLYTFFDKKNRFGAASWIYEEIQSNKKKFNGIPICTVSLGSLRDGVTLHDFTDVTLNYAHDGNICPLIGRTSPLKLYRPPDEGITLLWIFNFHQYGYLIKKCDGKICKCRHQTSYDCKRHFIYHEIQHY